MTKIEETRQNYAAEVKERWGKTSAYDERQRKTTAYDEATWGMINDKAAELLQAFAAIRSVPPASEDAQRLFRTTLVFKKIGA